MTAFRLIVHKYRSGGVVTYLCAGHLARELQSFICIIDYQFLAEGIDEMFCPAGDDELVWIARCETHCVTYHVSPQAA